MKIKPSNKSGLKSLVNKIDMFGVGYNFLISGRDKFKTTSGAVITLLYAMILSGLFMGFGWIYTKGKGRKFRSTRT